MKNKNKHTKTLQKGEINNTQVWYWIIDFLH